MQKYFNVNLEFDIEEVDRIIDSTIAEGGKGYVCSVESNNLTVANKNETFGEVVNNALVNICDGSVIALILSKIYGEKYASYIGADLFINYIEKKQYHQYFLGNTSEVLNGLKNNLKNIDPKIENMHFVELPFKRVEDFDYEAIGKHINEANPDIIWVSLGAPKQEFFMARLLPHINRGVMFGFGAIFNFNSGTEQVKRAPKWMRKLKLEWLYRACEEPKKNIPRYWGFIKIMPSLILAERKKVRKLLP